MKLNTWYKVENSNTQFYRYYFTQLDNGLYFGIEYNLRAKVIVAVDTWPGHDTQDEMVFEKPIFSREVYEKKLIDFAFLHGDIL